MNGVAIIAMNGVVTIAMNIILFVNIGPLKPRKLNFGSAPQ